MSNEDKKKKKKFGVHPQFFLKIIKHRKPRDTRKHDQPTNSVRDNI